MITNLKSSLAHQYPVDDRYITIEEFRKKYSMGTTKVYRLMHMPGFPRLKIGGKVLIPENAVHQWVVENAERSAL